MNHSDEAETLVVFEYNSQFFIQNLFGLVFWEQKHVETCMC